MPELEGPISRVFIYKYHMVSLYYDGKIILAFFCLDYCTPAVGSHFATLGCRS